VIIDAVLYKNFLAPAQLLAAVILLFAVFKTAQLNRKH